MSEPPADPPSDPPSDPPKEEEKTEETPVEQAAEGTEGEGGGGDVTDDVGIVSKSLASGDMQEFASPDTTMDEDEIIEEVLDETEYEDEVLDDDDDIVEEVIDETEGSIIEEVIDDSEPAGGDMDPLVEVEEGTERSAGGADTDAEQPDKEMTVGEGATEQEPSSLAQKSEPKSEPESTEAKSESKSEETVAAEDKLSTEVEATKATEEEGNTGEEVQAEPEPVTVAPAETKSDEEPKTEPDAPKEESVEPKAETEEPKVETEESKAETEESKGEKEEPNATETDQPESEAVDAEQSHEADSALPAEIQEDVEVPTPATVGEESQGSVTENQVVTNSLEAGAETEETPTVEASMTSPEEPPDADPSTEESKAPDKESKAEAMGDVPVEDEVTLNEENDEGIQGEDLGMKTSEPEEAQPTARSDEPQISESDLETSTPKEEPESTSDGDDTTPAVTATSVAVGAASGDEIAIEPSPVEAQVDETPDAFVDALSSPREISPDAEETDEPVQESKVPEAAAVAAGAAVATGGAAAAIAAGTEDRTPTVEAVPSSEAVNTVKEEPAMTMTSSEPEAVPENEAIPIDAEPKQDESQREDEPGMIAAVPVITPLAAALADLDAEEPAPNAEISEVAPDPPSNSETLPVQASLNQETPTIETPTTSPAQLTPVVEDEAVVGTPIEEPTSADPPVFKRPESPELIKSIYSQDEEDPTDEIRGADVFPIVAVGSAAATGATIAESNAPDPPSEQQAVYPDQNPIEAVSHQEVELSSQSEDAGTDTRDDIFRSAPPVETIQPEVIEQNTSMDNYHDAVMDQSADDQSKFVDHDEETDQGQEKGDVLAAAAVGATTAAGVAAASADQSTGAEVQENLGKDTVQDAVDKDVEAAVDLPQEPLLVDDLAIDEQSSNRRLSAKPRDIIGIAIVVIIVIGLVVALPLVLIDRDSGSPAGNSTARPTSRPLTNKPTISPGKPTPAPTAMPTSVPFPQYVSSGGPFNGTQGSGLGFAVGLSNNRAVAGAPDRGPGSVLTYIQTAGSWNNTPIALGGPQEGGNFGQALDLQGRILVVGAPGIIFPGTTFPAGAVYAYDFNARLSRWVQLGTTMQGIGDEASVGEQFGGAVARSFGDRIVVGAPYRNGSDGGVYIFSLNVVGSNLTWELMSGSPISVNNSQELLGSSVDISSDGKRIIAGGPNALGGTGKVSVYQQSDTIGQWIEIFNVTGANVGDQMGTAVKFLDVTGDQFVVGAPGAKEAVGNLRNRRRMQQGATGLVRVYQLVNSELPYSQLGPDLYGKTRSVIGNSGAIDGFASSTGTTLLLGTSDGFLKRFEYAVNASSWSETFTPLDTGFNSPVTGIASTSDLDSVFVGASDSDTSAVYSVQAPPTQSPTSDPTASPTGRPTTSLPTGPPIAKPTVQPTSRTPTVQPGSPTITPTSSPAGPGAPTSGPTVSPGVVPTSQPISSPTSSPTAGPTPIPGPRWRNDGAFVGAPGDDFGVSVSVTQTILAAGSRTGSGYVRTYQFVNNAWSFLSDINGLQDNSFFGNSVYLNPSSSSSLVVGAPATRVGNTVTGIAHVYSLSGETWSQQGSILQGNQTQPEFFGWSVAMSSNSVVVVSAPFNSDEGVPRRGRIYTFVFDGTDWVPRGSGAPVLGDANENLGLSLDISPDGSTLIAGATGFQENRGAFYVYTWNGSDWSLAGFRVGGSQGERFGSVVKVISDDGSVIAAGAPDFDSGKGVIRAYSRQSSGEYTVYGDPIVGNANDRLGSAKSISGSVSQVGVSSIIASTDNGETRTYALNSTSNTWAQELPIIIITANAPPAVSGSLALNTLATGELNEVRLYSVR